MTFVRHWLGDTLQEFADRVGGSHPAVIKWEDAGDESTPMSKGNEYLIRAHVAAQLRAGGHIGESEFADLVSEAMDFDPDREPEFVEIDGMELVADDWGDGEVLRGDRESRRPRRNGLARDCGLLAGVTRRVARVN